MSRRGRSVGLIHVEGHSGGGLCVRHRDLKKGISSPPFGPEAEISPYARPLFVSYEKKQNLRKVLLQFPVTQKALSRDPFPHRSAILQDLLL